ncbi:RHS repeat-associated core domain-containing protein [Pyxidicoccus trucidator]|uniref:RHS repeat-associated core domain-containing protein n=1 Tax=Pyxidicoccus trucidator TaxID=2709662 RepID=UPI0013DB64BA|nr:RHS repeat-associated core domain-containing protein [Pyxidicoccus trucidator]
MNPDTQNGRGRLSRWAVAALVLTAVGVAVAQTAGSTESDAEVQADVEKATATPLPPLGGPRTAGVDGEVSLGSLRANYSHTDVTVRGTLGTVAFERRYAMDTLSDMARLNQRPDWPPFGSMKADALGHYRHAAALQCGIAINPEEKNDCKGGLRWRHNWDSWVMHEAKELPCQVGSGDLCETDPQYDLKWKVRDPDGNVLVFKPCYLGRSGGLPPLTSCFARNHADSDVKLEYFEHAYVLHTPKGRYVYAEPLYSFGTQPEFPPEPGWVSYRLSYVLTPELEAPGCSIFGPATACQRRVATLHYDKVCVSDKAQVLNPGDNTYVTSIEVAGGGTLWLDYGAVHIRNRNQLINYIADGGTDGKFVPSKECVLKKIWLSPPGATVPPTADEPVVSYLYTEGTYENDTGNTTERVSGLLEEAVLLAGGPVAGAAGTETRLRYEYVEPVLHADGGASSQPLRTFRVLRNGLFERELVMDSADGAYVKQVRVGDTQVNLWADNNYNPYRVPNGGSPPYCHPGRFGTPPEASDCLGSQTQHQQTQWTTVGDGSGVLLPGLRQDSFMSVKIKSPHGPLLADAGVACTGAACNALAPGQRNRTWGVKSMDPCRPGQSCHPLLYDYNVFATSSVRDMRGNRVVYDNELAPIGVGVPDGGIGGAVSLPPVELNRVRAGASQVDGSDALLTRHFTYSYGPTYRQQVKDEWGDSSLVPYGAYQVRRHYDAATGRLTGVVKSGYTLQFDTTTHTWAPVQRHLATFYRSTYSCSVDSGAARTGHGDAKGRVVEVAGPCPVSGPDDPQCASGQFTVPVTQYEYWPESAAPQLAGRLAVKRVFSRTYGDGTCNIPGLPVAPTSYVETRYENYDARGQLTQLRDANDVVTKYLYAGNKLVETRVADGMPLVAVTTYGYDTGQGTGDWVRHPDGRYEVQCFRTGTTPGLGCTGGVLTDKLQWKATSRAPNGFIYSERADYLYTVNGQLMGETVSDSTGAVRRQRYFDGDPLGRTTYEAMGSAVSAAASDSRYHQVSLFDMEGNRVGLGTAYQPTSSPLEPLCGGFGPQSTQADALPASPLCKAFQYDRLNRLSRLIEPMDTQGSEVAVTCLAYDVRGNLASVNRAGASRPCDPAAQHIVHYTHDDFGNLVRVTAPWARSASGLAGEYRYGYDTAGNLAVKQTPSMAQATPATWVEYKYDAMGRPLWAQAGTASTYNSYQTLFSYGYDGQEFAPTFCPGSSTYQDGLPRQKGRAQVLTDSFGDTWFAYDVHGRPTAHWRVRAKAGHAPRTQGCGRANTPDYPNRWFYYDPAGRLVNEVLPGGRGLYYVFHSSDLSMPHRVEEVRATTWSGSSWNNSMTVVKDVQWEPYGGIRSYAVQTHQSTGTGSTPWRYVDYLRTAPATVPLAKCNETAIVTGSDYTGRLKAVTVSTEAERAANRHGDIYKRVYTWKADQVVREDTCVLEAGDVAPETLKYAGVQGEAGFDTRGQLRHVSGRPYDLRTYVHDSLGNRFSERRGNFVFQLGYVPGTGGLREDQLRTRTTRECTDASCAQSTALSSPTESYDYDDDGRLAVKGWDGLAPDPRRLGQLTFGTALDGPHAALGAVYRSVSDDSGRTWEYFYDAVGRRRLKQHLGGASEEYFHDKTFLMEDWGVTSLNAAEADSVRDEYIWLDGRPVVVFKARVNHTGGRVADFTGTCERHTDDVAPACGVYFPITDVLGKPVLMLDGAGLVTGVADHDAFGHVNRVSHPAESPHPSTFGGQQLLLDTTTALPAPRAGISVHVRGRFSVLQGWDGGEAFLTNGSDVRLSPVTSGGLTGVISTAGRSAATPWANASSVSQVRVYFSEPANPAYDDTQPSPWGASLEGLEYRRFQTGATPVWLPLRLPGQYHDVETDLFENWNRYYDANLGRYLAPEPKLMNAAAVVKQLGDGSGTPVYAYARGNPVRMTDPDGLDAINRSSDDAWVKPEGENSPYCVIAVNGKATCGVSRDGTTPVKLAPGEKYVSPTGRQDGVSTSARPGEVFKTKDGIDATILPGGKVEVSPTSIVATADSVLVTSIDVGSMEHAMATPLGDFLMKKQQPNPEDPHSGGWKNSDWVEQHGGAGWKPLLEKSRSDPKQGTK